MKEIFLSFVSPFLGDIIIYRPKELTSKNFSCVERNSQVLVHEASHGCCRPTAMKLISSSITFQRLLTSCECRGSLKFIEVVVVLNFEMIGAL